MGLSWTLGPVLAVGVALAAVFGVIYSTPELEEFRSKEVYYGQAMNSTFVPVATGLYKLDLTWHVTPFHEEVLDLYLVNHGTSWYLTDAGGFDTWLQRHASQIVNAVQKQIPPGDTLSHIVLTHGHYDHVGAIAPLLKRYPELRVVFHEDEAEYLTGSKVYMPLSEFGYAYNLVTSVGLIPATEYKIPKDRVALLRGPKGNLNSVGVADLEFTLCPGHSPGHVVYLHRPSHLLLAGDITDIVVRNGSLACMIACGPECRLPQAKASLCQVVHDVEYSRMLPYHDATKGGFTKEQIAPLAEAYAHCSTLAAP